MSGPFAHIFLAGVYAMGLALIGAYFLRFWRRSGERLFLAFAMAFGLMSVSSGAAAYLDSGHKDPAPIYLLRLCAFSLILGGIIAKNLDSRNKE